MFQTSLIILVIVIIGSAYYMREALKKLNAEQKVQLIDTSVGKGYLINIIIFFGGLLCIALLSTQSNKTIAALAYAVGLPILIICVIAFGIWSRISLYKRLKTSGLPDHYLRSMKITNIVIYLALIFFLASLFYK